ncbi:hypothetical protein V6N11_052070 [Hibiscus sabdariffa]|uniref:SWIM-type domain-containing protein n=1 Tax=Hibiscus sabdariffa TaxID=183260 RepID=A0ABR2U917_9ROSI
MEIVESILDIPVQDPPQEFSATELTWKKGRKRSDDSLKEYKSDEYLEYRRYWCSFRPENYGEGGGILPSRKYHLNTRNRAARPQSMRGCRCHFVVKRLYARPSLALIIYNERHHVNKSGFVCHGPLDRDAIGPGAKKIPYISNEIEQQTMSMIYLGIPEENVLEKHIECIQQYCGLDATFSTLSSQYVRKLGTIIERSTHELDLDDQASTRMWIERNKKSIFFYQETSETDPFLLGIQTEWQLKQMVRFGHRNLIAADSTFGIKRLKYPFCTLLVFDSRHHALPVAWIITNSVAKNTFCCPILFSLWRVRRSWLMNVVKKCSNIEVQREIFKRLGEIVYGIRGGVNTSVSLEELIQDFADQTAFMNYFKSSWVPKIEMWLLTMKSFPLASQETSGAIEAYHVKLKTKLFDDSHLGALQRNVKEEYIASTSWYRALQIPDSAVTLDENFHLFAKVASLKESSITHLIWNPGSDFASCDCAWSMQANFCKHVIKRMTIVLDESVAWTYQMLDQIKQLVELNSSNDIRMTVNNMPLKCVSKKGRTFVGIPGSFRALPCTSKTIAKNLQKKITQ